MRELPTSRKIASLDRRGEWSDSSVMLLRSAVDDEGGVPMRERALSQDTGQTATTAYSSAQQSGRAASGKWLAGLLGVVLVGAVLSPIAENWRREPEDGFPL